MRGLFREGREIKYGLRQRPCVSLGLNHGLAHTKTTWHQQTAPDRNGVADGFVWITVIAGRGNALHGRAVWRLGMTAEYECIGFNAPVLANVACAGGVAVCWAISEEPVVLVRGDADCSGGRP